ncbi:MAG: DNA internalization-related competence protein ComEC/Rec2 [Rheinheimera sp.]|nr:MAG: DNA internalization-related competence protein ComEC/Rec2 [Rheinheimera sp.]
MERFSFGVLAAALLTLWLEQLPPLRPLVLVCLLVLVVAPLLSAGLRRYHACLCGALAYLLCLSWQLQQHQQISTQVVAEHTTEVCGRVVSLPRQFVENSRFVLQFSDDCAEKPQVAAGRLLEVRWYAEAGQTLPMVKAGQHWRLPVKFKAVRGLANPGSPWREANALVDGIVAVATVQTAATAVLLADTSSLRQQLADHFAACCQHYAAYPLWLALTIGDRPFSDELWLGVQHAGMAHLLSISGMHIALLFGLCLLTKPLWAWLGLPEPWRSLALWTFALSVAWSYAALAGFAIPTLRAVLTLSLLVLLRLCWRRVSLWQLSWLLTALLLLIWPFWLFSFSFWLSALALALLALLEWQQPLRSGFWPLCRRFASFQLGFSLLLLPVSLLLFQGVAPFALWLNLLLLPLMTLLGIPILLLLFGWLCLTGAVPAFAWHSLDLLYWPLLQALQWAALADGWWSLPALPWYGALLLLPPVLLGWFCRGRWQWAALPLLLSILALMFNAGEPLSAGGAAAEKPSAPLYFHLLDVGQGSSAVLQQGEHAILFDLGPAYGAVSATRQVVLPFLRYLGIRELDYVVVSHDDSDHSGNWPLLRSRYPKAVLVSDIRRLAPRFDCLDLPSTWRGVRLHAFRAGPYQPEPGNEDSCAVLIDTGRYRLLLPGDLGRHEMTVAKAISRQFAGIDVLVLGHHGSKTASSLAFLMALQPRLALASSGYQNQFGHPAADTQARLSLRQIPLLNTADSGAVQLHLSAKSLQYQQYRPRRFARWLEK